MSKRMDAIITCPNCKNKFEFELYRSIWGEYPENRELVFSDKINVAICPKCNTATKLPFPLMYTNVKKRFAVRWEPEYDPQIDEDEKGYAKAFGEGNFYQTAPRIQDWDEFKEKIVEFESMETIGKPLQPSKEVKENFEGFINQEFGGVINKKSEGLVVSETEKDKTYEELTQKIVLAGLKYRKEIKYEVDNKLSADAGAEIIYFLIHWVDRTSFQIFGNQKRDEIYDIIYKRVISEYCRAILTPDAPQSLLENLAFQMLETLNKRQIIYSQCVCCLGQEPSFPSIGTMEFALSFYIHKALGKTTRDDVDNILKGKEKLTKNDLTDFPYPEDQLADCIFIHNALANSKMPTLIKEL